MRPFEEKIVEDFKGTEGKPGGGKQVPRTRPWITEHLKDVGEDYPYGIFKRYKEFCVENGLPVSSFPSIRVMIYKLSKEGIIRRSVRTEMGIRFERHYWKLT